MRSLLFFAAEPRRQQKMTGGLIGANLAPARGRTHLQEATGGVEQLLRGQVRPAETLDQGTPLLVLVLVPIGRAHHPCHGAHKVGKATQRARHDIGRDKVVRLIKPTGMAGVHRGPAAVTASHDPGTGLTSRPGQAPFRGRKTQCVWVTGLTYLAAWARMANVRLSSTPSAGSRVTTNMTVKCS